MLVWEEPFSATTGAFNHWLASTAGAAKALVASTEKARPRISLLVFMRVAPVRLISGSFGMEPMLLAAKIIRTHCDW
jgi:hypothetical protein